MWTSTFNRPTSQHLTTHLSAINLVATRSAIQSSSRYEHIILSSVSPGMTSLDCSSLEDHHVLPFRSSRL
eukprot:12519900-Prorocentrum_lima.AAC.1